MPNEIPRAGIQPAQSERPRPGASELDVTRLRTLCIGYAEWRRVSVDRALRADTYSGPDPRATLAMIVIGVVLGLGMLVLILFEA